MYMYVCMYVCMHACMRECMHACMHADINASIHERGVAVEQRGSCLKKAEKIMSHEHVLLNQNGVIDACGLLPHGCQCDPICVCTYT